MIKKRRIVSLKTTRDIPLMNSFPFEHVAFGSIRDITNGLLDCEDGRVLSVLTFEVEEVKVESELPPCLYKFSILYGKDPNVAKLIPRWYCCFWKGESGRVGKYTFYLPHPTDFVFPFIEITYIGDELVPNQAEMKHYPHFESSIGLFVVAPNNAVSPINDHTFPENEMNILLPEVSSYMYSGQSGEVCGFPEATRMKLESEFRRLNAPFISN